MLNKSGYNKNTLISDYQKNDLQMNQEMVKIKNKLDEISFKKKNLNKTISNIIDQLESSTKD